VPVPLGPLRELASAAGAGALAELDGDDRLALAGSLLAVLGRRAPVVAVVEDAHWADPGTLDVIRLLARRVEDAGVIVVVTYRDDELAAHPMLSALVGDLTTSPARRAATPHWPQRTRSVSELSTKRAYSWSARCGSGPG
jgi:type II secretory pathway predicted ATPase ExeA